MDEFDQAQGKVPEDQGSDMIRMRGTRRRGKIEEVPLWKRPPFWVAVAAAALAAIALTLWLVTSSP